jgi:pimeloyl-ACP methyl ester carboxylesterase
MNNEPEKHWILLRGLARESRHWGAFIPKLQTMFPDAKITLLDLPGTGCLYQETSPNTIAQITHQVRAQALAKGCLQQPVNLLALSLGAMVAWEWMQNYPEDIATATLINTSFASLSPFYQRLRWQSYHRFINLVLTSNVRQREEKILQLTSNNADANSSVILDWEKIQSEQPISFKNSLQQILAAASYKPSDKKPSHPVLLLNSLQDRLVSPRCSMAIQQQWQLELRSHVSAGHDLTLDAGDWVAKQLKNWLIKLVSTSG